MKLIGAHGCKLVRVSFFTIFLGLLPFFASVASAAPDLVIGAHRAKVSVECVKTIFDAADCANREGCVRGTGTRKLLKLNVAIINQGATDLFMGDPNKRPDLFVWSGCHNHYHLMGLATYRLLRLNGSQIAKTYKQGFCLRDDAPRMSYAGPAKYTCDYQGISRGWEDMYDKSLDCQWVDITGVPAGRYNLEITINPAGRLPESNYRNNRAIFPITVPRSVPYSY